MRRWYVVFTLIASCIVSSAVGYWFGFREALAFGIAADSLPRGAIATYYLRALRAGKHANFTIGLESDVDLGLIWGHELFRHPLRHVMGPLWGFEFYPEYEKYAVRLADYRKEHPSLTKPDMFDEVPPDKEQYREFYRELAQGTRENVAKINAMVERYATKP